jgi:hypothetical protein
MIGRDLLGSHRVVFGGNPAQTTITASDFAVV